MARDMGRDIADELRRIIASESTRLMSLSDEAASIRPSPAKWSPKEVLGHLIDSASNNHARFVGAQLSEELVFPRYEQDAWVRVQNYNSRPWTELITLWRSLNAHIASVIGEMSPESLTKARVRHNLDQIAWRTVPRATPATLEYFVRDYIGHLRHHLAQIS
ncbi:MAG: DinB family protein [Gemmatimonadaceae bacterium]